MATFMVLGESAEGRIDHRLHADLDIASEYVLQSMASVSITMSLRSPAS